MIVCFENLVWDLFNHWLGWIRGRSRRDGDFSSTPSSSGVCCNIFEEKSSILCCIPDLSSQIQTSTPHCKLCLQKSRPSLPSPPSVSWPPDGWTASGNKYPVWMQIFHKTCCHSKISGSLTLEHCHQIVGYFSNAKGAGTVWDNMRRSRTVGQHAPQDYTHFPSENLWICKKMLHLWIGSEQGLIF